MMAKRYKKLNLRIARDFEDTVKDLIRQAFGWKSDRSYTCILGMFKTLELMGYGYLDGNPHTNAVDEGRGQVSIQNFNWWLAQLEEEVKIECQKQENLSK